MQNEHYSAALSILKTLQKANHTTYFVGGWVRDYLLKHPSDDIDIATSASPDEVVALFEKTIPVGISFGVVIVVIDGHQFEVATFREEEGYTDGRRPTSIKQTTAQNDAGRRDFTINGLFFDPAQDKVIDYVEGESDLKKGIIRAIGNPHDRFLEDRLRMIRAVRYSARFSFPIEPVTLAAIAKHKNDLFPAVSIERVVQEMEKMARYPHFDQALLLMHELGLLSIIFPELTSLSQETLIQLTQYFALYPKETPLILFLLALLPKMNNEDKLALCDRFKMSKKAHLLVTFHHHLMPHLKTNHPSEVKDSTWVKHYASPFFSLCLQIHILSLNDENQMTLKQFHLEREIKLREAIERHQSHNALLSARDLIKEGITPSPLLGTLIAEGEQIAIDENLHEKMAVLTRLKQSKHWPKKS